MHAVSNDTFELSEAGLLAEKPLVSVLMVTYNHGEYIAQAIESVVSQNTEFPIELLIGEDCSKDNTRDVAFGFQEKYPDKIRVIYSESNVGVHKNLNRIIAKTRGEFVALCDGDDYWGDVRKLQLQVEALRRNPDCVVTYHDVIYLSSMRETEPRSLLAKERRRGFSREELLRYSYMPTVSMCFRNVIKNLPDEFDKVVNADTFLISVLGTRGSALFIEEIKPAIYREHRGGVWSPLSSEDKRINTITTFYWLSVFHKKENRNPVSNHYAFAAMTHLLEAIHLNRKSFLKWFLINYFTRTYAIYRSIKLRWKGNF